MDNLRFRAILVRLQDRLSDDDRKRLHFFLGNDIPRRIRDDPSLGGTFCLMESLFDQDKINEQDSTFLINAFDEIQCTDAVKLLREHMRRIQSNEIEQSVQSLSLLMPPVVDQLLEDQDDGCAVRTHPINQTCIYGNTNTVVKSTNTNSNPLTAVVNGSRQLSLPKNQKQLLTAEHRRSYGALLIIIVGILIGGSFWIINLKNKYDNSLKKLEENDRRIEHLTELLIGNNKTMILLNGNLAEKNKTIEDLTRKVDRLEFEQNTVIGTTCGCAQWCKENGSAYGVCGNGPTCICSPHPLTKENTSSGCTCDEWCQKRGYKNGGICGDGFTCICSR